MWTVIYGPFGQPYSITGTASNNQRLPGQWHQLEAGLAYNWHRHYDPSLGRYTQPDPLSFFDGPSVYAYARSNPQRFVDPDGRLADTVGEIMLVTGAVVAMAAMCYNAAKKFFSSSPPQSKPQNDNCPPGMCCLIGEEKAVSPNQGKQCAYRCGNDNDSRVVTIS